MQGVPTEPRHAVVVGTGQVATELWLPALAKVGLAASVTDLDPARARSVANRMDIDCLDLNAVPDLGAQDLVIIATPPRSHCAVALEWLERGACNLLLEKPPVVVRNELDNLLRRAQETGATLWTSFVRRQWGPVRVAAAWYDDWRARWGHLEYISIADGGPWSWRSMATQSEGAAGLTPILLDESAHALDVAFHITGIDDVSIESPAVSRRSKWELAASGTLVHAEGQTTLVARWSRVESLSNSIAFAFERGAAFVELLSHGCVLWRDDSRDEVELKRGLATPTEIPDLFSELIEQVAERVAPRLEEWRSPLTVNEAFLRASGDLG